MSADRVHPHDHDDDSVEAHHSGLERLEALAILKAPCGCYDGLVFIGHMAPDPETGEEVEVFEAVPCRRCNA